MILGKSGGIIGTDGRENNGHLVTNCVSPLDYSVIGSISNSNYDATVRTAPTYAFYQTAILDILNKNTIKPNSLTNNDTSKEIFTGSFVYAEYERNSDENGKLPYPAEISGLFEKTYVEGSQ